MQLLLVTCAFHFKECDLVIHLRMNLMLTTQVVLLMCL